MFTQNNSITFTPHNAIIQYAYMPLHYAKYIKYDNDVINAISTCYGTELMEDNTEELKERLYKLLTSYNFNITDEIKNIVNNNIVCTDFFKWDYENWRPIKENKCDALF